MHFSLQVPPEIKVTAAKIGGSRRPQYFAHYSVVEHFIAPMELSTVCAIALSCWKYL
jgi:hypothetical protein